MNHNLLIYITPKIIRPITYYEDILVINEHNVMIAFLVYWKLCKNYSIKVPSFGFPFIKNWWEKVSILVLQCEIMYVLRYTNISIILFLPIICYFTTSLITSRWSKHNFMMRNQNSIAMIIIPFHIQWFYECHEYGKRRDVVNIIF